MIETTISEVDGVRFYKNIKILEPDDTIGGFPVHYIPNRIADCDIEFMRAIKALCLKRVGVVFSMDAGQYAQSPMPFLAIKVAQFAIKTYWASIRWLYDNARFFKQIPVGECFSWRYFTPYAWYKKLGRGWKWLR